jgi:hypothetical protein
VESIMEAELEQYDRPTTAETRLRPRLPRIGVAGLILLPLALVIYLIALPVFGIFWLIEWILPLQPPAQDPRGNDFAPSRLQRHAEDFPY